MRSFIDRAVLHLSVVVIALAANPLFSQTTLGPHLYAVGSEEAARLAGVSSRRATFTACVISAVLAALADVPPAACMWSAQPNAGIDLELDAIAAAVLGGASLAGSVAAWRDAEFTAY